MVDRAEIRDIESKRFSTGRAYLSLKLDAPGFSAPTCSTLFHNEDSEDYSLIWSRPNGRRIDLSVMQAPWL